MFSHITGSLKLKMAPVQATRKGAEAKKDIKARGKRQREPELKGAQLRKKQKQDEDVILQEFVDAGVIIRTGLLDADSDSDYWQETEDSQPLTQVSYTKLQRKIATLSKDQLREVLTDLMYRIPAVKNMLIRELDTPSGLGALAMATSSDQGEIKVRITRVTTQKPSA